MDARKNRQRKARARRRLRGYAWQWASSRRRWRRRLVAAAGAGTITQTAAMRAAHEKLFEGCPALYVGRFQIREDRLCMDFVAFKDTLESALGRCVRTHELGMNRAGIEAELYGGKRPTFQETAELVSADKRVTVSL